MKVSRSLFLLLFLLLTIAAFAQTAPAPVIDSVTPTSGPTSGGTDVTITGSNFGVPPNFACFAPCPVKVSFGGVEVVAKDESATRVVATTPPSATARTVDVTLITGDGRRVTVTNAFAYTAGPEAAFEQILLPVYLDGTVAGGNGSLWRTDFWMRNAGPNNVAVAPWPCPDGLVCPPIFPPQYNLVAGETIHYLPPFFRAPTSNVSRLLYLGRGGAANVFTNLRVFDASREGLNAGTEIPVVRSSQFRSASLQLLNVPANVLFRQHLRIYDVANTNARFLVKIYENFSGTGNAPPLKQLEVTVSTTETGDFRSQAAYGEIPSLQALLPALSPSALRVEIEPLTPGSRYWAFASVTNNDTQLVTVVTPN